MASIQSKILSYSESLPEGTTLSAKELLHYGSRPAVDQALSRLAKNSELLRIGCGIYVKPVHTRFGQAYPSVKKVLENIMHKTGEVLVPPGAVSANKLNLITQIPMRLHYLTSGQSRTLKFGGRIVKLQNAPSWQLLEPNSVPGDVVRALEFMGTFHVKWTIDKLKQMLSKEDRRTVLSFRSRMPEWMAKEVSRLA